MEEYAQIEDILNHFHSLYNDKLKLIAESKTDGDCYTWLEQNNEVLTSYIKDVRAQNIVLVEAIEALQQGTERKMQALQQNIGVSVKEINQLTETVQNYERQFELFHNERSIIQKRYQFLKYELKSLKKEKKNLQLCLSMLEIDNNNIIKLICRIRDTGVWDMDGLGLQQTTYDTIFLEHPNLIGSKVETVHNKEKTSITSINITKYEEDIHKLEMQVQELNKSKKVLSQTLEEKERLVENFQKELELVSQDLELYKNETDKSKKSLHEVQAKLLSATNEKIENTITQQTEQSLKHEMSQTMKELINVKTELNMTLQEKQEAVLEAKGLKQQLNERLLEMQEMKKILLCIQNEATSTLNVVQVVQNKQDELLDLKEQVQTYHRKHDSYIDKIDMIQNLHQQINILIEKVSKLESVEVEAKVSKSLVEQSRKEKPGCLPSSPDLEFQTLAAGESYTLDIVNKPLNESVKELKIKAEETVSELMELNAKPSWNHHCRKSPSMTSTLTRETGKVLNRKSNALGLRRISPTLTPKDKSMKRLNPISSISKPTKCEKSTKKQIVSFKGMSKSNEEKKTNLISEVDSKSNDVKVLNVKNLTNKEPVNLPKSENTAKKSLKLLKKALKKSMISDSASQSNQLLTYPRSNSGEGLRDCPLPEIEMIESPVRSKLPKLSRKLEAKKPKINSGHVSQVAQRTTWNELMDVAVKTSQKLLKDSAIHYPYSSFRVIAGRSHSTSRNNVSKVESREKKAKVNIVPGLGIVTDHNTVVLKKPGESCSPKSNYQSEALLKKKETQIQYDLDINGSDENSYFKEMSTSSLENCSNLKGLSNRNRSISSKDLSAVEILSTLPVQSQHSTVQQWIENSSKTNLSSKDRKFTPSQRVGSNAHRSGIVLSRQRWNKVENKINSISEINLSLEAEWDKMFYIADRNQSENADGDKQTKNSINPFSVHCS